MEENENLQIVSYEKFDTEKDEQIAVDDVTVEYVQNPDCTENSEDAEFQRITLSTRNNGVARFINIKTDNWSVSDEADIIKLIEDFKKRALIENISEEKEINDKIDSKCKIGELFDNGVIKGVIASLDDDSSPHLIVSMEEVGLMDWNKAMEYNKTLQDGWHVPTKEELEEVWHNDSNVTKILNRGLKKYGGHLLRNWYWSSTEYGANNAYSVSVNTGGGGDNHKDFSSNKVRLFVTLS